MKRHILKSSINGPGLLAWLHRTLASGERPNQLPAESGAPTQRPSHGAEQGHARAHNLA